MIFAHRNNTSEDYAENSKDGILRCIELGYGAEIDIWVKNKKLYLGHDEYNLTEIEEDFLSQYDESLLIHCKNKKAVKFFMDSDKWFQWFVHDQDCFSFTNQGLLICYGIKPPKLNRYRSLTSKSTVDCIVMLPERFSIEVPKGYSVCTDYPERYV